MNSTYPLPLQPLIDYLSSLDGRPNIPSLQEKLEATKITAEELGQFVGFNKQGYRRNKVFESEEVELLCLCWKSGQRSPIHDHAHSVCGVKIILGTATETVYEMTPGGYIKPTHSADYPAELVMVSQDSETHQIANLQELDSDLVTLHVYSPPLRKMRTYSIDSPKPDVYIPVNEGHVDGCGI